MIDVFGLGQSCWDYIGQIESYPPADSKCELSSIIESGGGPAATALTALARWGLTCAFSGVFGDDSYGRRMIVDFKAEGIDTSGAVIRPNASSQVAFIVFEKNTARRTIFWRRPDGEEIQADEINFEQLRTSRAFYTDGLFIDASLAAAQVARKAGIPVIVDAGTLRARSLELAALSDYFIVSRSFARALTGSDEPQKACLDLQKQGPKVVGVTLGEKGSLILAGNRWIESPAYPVDTIDTTGCGDVFHAAITYGVLKNWDIAKTVDFASWTAAQVSTRIGGRAGIPPAGNYRERS
jgi:ribokinase